MSLQSIRLFDLHKFWAIYLLSQFKSNLYILGSIMSITVYALTSVAQSLQNTNVHEFIHTYISINTCSYNQYCLAEGKEDPTLRHSGFRNWSGKCSDLPIIIIFLKFIFICIFFVLCQITFFAISFYVDNTFTQHAVCWAILARIQLPNKKLYIRVRKKMKIIKLMLTEHNNVMFKKTKWFSCTWHSVALEALSSLALVFLHWPEETRLCPLSFNLWFMFL